MNHKVLFSALALGWLALLPAASRSQITEQWVARYNGTANNFDYAYAATVDVSGNVYVTGTSPGSGTGNDCATVKYNAAGLQQWAARYNGPGNGNDQGSAITVDDSGNVYVGGVSFGNGTGYDYLTVKYNSDGIQQWAAMYDGPPNAGDYGRSIAVDDTGNVYVTGYSSGGQTGTDYATIKYDHAGNVVWARRYDAATGASTTDEAYALAIDTRGNVYVTGWGYSSTTASQDYVTVKYNSAGLQLWAALYGGPGTASDDARSIAVDARGNVYITGRSGSGINSPDYATVKYDSSGVQQWAARYNGPGDLTDIAYSVAVDGSGNVYVTGESEGSGTLADYATLKYDPAGVQQWASRYAGLVTTSGDMASSVAVDGLGNVYATGRSGSGTGVDYATVKYDPSGVQQWAQRYNGPGRGIDEASSILLDGSGNVYVTGWSGGTGTSYDFATIKYSQTPTDVHHADAAQPEEYSLLQNYPNPFNPTTTIRYALPNRGRVSLTICNALGQQVRTLVNGEQEAGFHEVHFDASNLASGVYFYRLTAGDFVQSRKLVLMK